MSKELKIPPAVTAVAGVILAGGGVACLLAFTYFAYYYVWSGQRQFSGWTGVVLYFVAPAVLAALLLAALKLKPANRANAALLLVAFTATLYLAELSLQLSESYFVTSRKPRFTSAEAEELGKTFGVVIDTRDGLEVVAEMQKKGIEAVPAVLPKDDLLIDNKQPDGSLRSALTVRGSELLPLAGIADKVTVICNESGPWVTYESDEHGFNNPRGTWQSGLEIGIVGDSYTQGQCVPSDSNFVALIREHKPKLANVGIGANGPLLELATLKEYLQPFKPKVVLWVYYEGNDLVDLQIEKKSNLLTNYLKRDFSQNLLERQGEIDEAITNEIPRQIARHRSNWSSGNLGHFLHGMKGEEAATNPNLTPKTAIEVLSPALKLSSLRERLGLIYGTDTRDVEKQRDLEGPNMRLFREVLSEAAVTVGGWGGTLYFVYLPSQRRYLPPRNPIADFSDNFGIKQRLQVMTFVNSLRIPVIDVYPAFESHTDPASLFPFRKPGHYNEEGHRLVAKSILDAIPDFRETSPASVSSELSKP